MSISSPPASFTDSTKRKLDDELGARDVGGRRLSLASAAVEQERDNQMWKSQQQECINFLERYNDDLAAILDSNLVQRNPTERFANGARAVLATIRLTSAGRTRPTPDDCKEQFKEVLARSLQASVLKRSHTTTPSGSRIAGVRKRPHTIEPMPDGVRQLSSQKLSQVGGMSQLAGTATAGIGGVGGSGGNKLHSTLLNRSVATSQRSKEKELMVITGRVNYSALLEDQRILTKQTDEKEVKYRAMINEFDANQKAIQRRFSLLLKPSQSMIGVPQSDM